MAASTTIMKEKIANHSFDKLAKPAQRALANAGIKTLEQLSQLTEAEFMKLHGIGKNALQTLKAVMDENGLSFAKKS
jgi:DNA-directed RNA polymerase alpha subunit